MQIARSQNTIPADCIPDFLSQGQAIVSLQAGPEMLWTMAGMHEAPRAAVVYCSTMRSRDTVKLINRRRRYVRGSLRYEASSHHLFQAVARLWPNAGVPGSKQRCIPRPLRDAYLKRYYDNRASEEMCITNLSRGLVPSRAHTCVHAREQTSPALTSASMSTVQGMAPPRAPQL